ncbi:VOC family protein [Chelativorans xinjiangense]|uniref:VOC family protein n=1 Tax=Chelativorans xinjiangense TaxID=2681485 RepID=UPI00135A8778|nr:VOC family protein [Chelativorans xinjiangense]
MTAPCVSLELDHLTVAALTLEEGVAYIQSTLGVEVPPGGAHPLMGTHNHLMRLGDKEFLEVIAPDPKAVPRRARWFALDDLRMRTRLRSSPQLISWVARVPDLARALRQVEGVAGEAVGVTRGALSWLISVPDDGSMPFGGAFPTLLEWPRGPHPSLRMVDRGCRLERLDITHPEGVRLAEVLAPVFTDDRVTISTGPTAQIRATITTPRGQRELV